MRLWRLASARRAADFDGGMEFSTMAAGIRAAVRYLLRTVPSLAALEKRVHVTDPALLPPQVMVAYEVPDGISTPTVISTNCPRIGSGSRRTRRASATAG